MFYAIVTGASKGLGKAFAHELASRNINTLLVSLPGERLEELNALIRSKYQTNSFYFEIDLTSKEALVTLCQYINEQFDVFMLINNAGCGGTKPFAEADPDYLDTIIQLNIRATTLLTRLLLPNLMKREEAYVLNVSSMAAFSPMGYKTVYPASKAFVHHFTRGLYQELAHTSVFVSVVNPGPMNTNKEVSQRIARQGKLARFGIMTPERVARISITQLLKRDTLIMLNFVNGLNWLLMKVIPIWIRLPLLTRIIQRELQPA